MDLDAFFTDPEKDRQSLYRELLSKPIYVRGPEIRAWAVSQPDSGQRAIPAFLSQESAEQFWAEATPGRPVSVLQFQLAPLTAEALAVGALVLEPRSAGLVIDRPDLRILAHSEVPGAFSAWMRELGRLGRQPAEVTARLRQSHVHVITGKSDEGTYRLYLLGKSDDGSLAVPCFTAPETLSQFAEIRRLAEGGRPMSVAIYSGDECLRIAAGMGAVVLIDPESAWETQVEPSLLDSAKPQN